MNPRSLMILGLMLLLSRSLFSQAEFFPAYIVTHQNDTIYGRGNVNIDQKSCMFKPNGEKDYQVYKPEHLSAIRIIEGKYYVSKEITDKDGIKRWYFLEFLVDGKIDLYTVSISERFFIKKENADFLELNDKQEAIQHVEGKEYVVQDRKYLGYLRSYMSETPELFSEIDKMKSLKQKDLVKLSIDYHHAICDDNKCINYAKEVPETRFKLELFSGLNYHNNYYSPQAGLLIHINRPVLSERLYLRTGIIYSEKPYWKKDVLVREERIFSLKIPISLQYVFGNKDFKPTVAYGWPTGIFLISSLEAGFIYSFSKRFEVRLSGSIDGPFAFTLNQHRYLFNNKFAHSFNFGLIYGLN